MGFFNFYIIKKLLSKFFTKRTLIFIIIFLLIIILKSNVFAVDAVYDLEQEIKDAQEVKQQNFVFFCYYPYLSNSQFWVEDLKPVIDEIRVKHDFYVSSYRNTQLYIDYTIYVFDSWTANSTTMNYTSALDNTNYSIPALEFLPNINDRVDGYTKYRVRFYKDTNSGAVTNETSNTSFYVPMCLRGYRSYVADEFFLNVETGGGSYTSYLNTINTYLDSIDDVNSDILTILNTISSSLSQVSQNTSTDYSQGINQISDKITDILSDNDTIISQNADMIEQQEQINENLENVDESVQELKDTITNPNIESGASDLPSTSVNDPTSGGIDNIFQSIYNAFCVGDAQDIVFPIPFTDKNITLSPYYLRDMLNNNNAGWIYTLIQAFWGYLIGRYIVSDISKKIDKIKSGNIENVENSNIKEEML